MSDLQLSAIFIYPVKSLRGIAVKQWPVDQNGLRFDRHWMLIDNDNQFMSQRRLPRMALIQTALSDFELVLSAPGMADLHLGLLEHTGEQVYAQVWHDRCLTYVVSAQADHWLSEFLGVPCRLVLQPEHSIRPVDPDYAHAEDQTSLSDGFPFLLISESSLAALNAQLPAPVDMRRFRPNLVVSGCEAYAEDSWREISIGQISFRLPKPCSRCAVPNIHPDTALSDKEPLKTLSRHRQWQNKVYFGQNVLHNATGVLQEQMTVTVLRAGINQPPL